MSGSVDATGPIRQRAAAEVREYDRYVRARDLGYRHDFEKWKRDLLRDGTTCPVCFHPAEKHYRDPEQAIKRGCMKMVDSSWTVTNEIPCACSRVRATTDRREQP